MSLTDEQRQLHERLNTDFRFFAKHAPLKVQPKEGSQLVTLTLNRAQEYAHELAEKQLALTGKVRALVVKGRQQGISTYIEARFYHKTSRIPYTNAFIVTHHTDATKNVFKMVKRYHDNVVEPMRPQTEKSNDTELIFDGIGSSYGVGTAGTPNVGRSRTIRLFHGSEVAYWQNPEDIRKGAMEAVPDARGTEIWLESTAKGMGGMFHEMVMQALKGESDYIVIFCPWFWQAEYARPVPEDFTLTDEESEYQRLHNLSLEQMAWRRAKIQSLKDIHEFKREYPATVHEAFEASGGGLFNPADIMRARKSKVTDKAAPLIIGVDPAPKKDRTILVFRRGREVPHWIKKEGGMDPMVLVGLIARLIDRHNPDAVFVDVAEGYAVVSRLNEMGYDQVFAIHFGSGADQEEVYANKRAEMYGDANDWLREDGKRIPDSDEFHADLAVIPKFTQNSSSRKLLPKKEKIKEECGFSPDIADAFALTFAQKIKARAAQHQHENQNAEGGLKTLKRIRKGA